MEPFDMTEFRRKLAGISFRTFGLGEQQFGDEPQCQLSIMHTRSSQALLIRIVLLAAASSPSRRIPSPLAIASTAAVQSGQPSALYARVHYSF